MKMNLTNNQEAFEYVIYMIAGSYFKSTKCVRPLLEKKLHLRYNEQKSDNQYMMEETCDRYMKKEVIKNLPADFEDWDMVVTFKEKENAPTEIIFGNGEYKLSFLGIYSGKKSKINCKITKKDK